MNRFLLASAVTAALVVGSATQARAEWVCYGTIQGSQENPPIASTAVGTVTVVLNNQRTNMTIVAQVFNFDLTSITASHIHRAPAGTDGPVVFQIGDGNFYDAARPYPIAINWSAGPPPDPTNPESVDPAFLMMADQLIAGNLYFNMHSAAHPGGEARAQITCL